MTFPLFYFPDKLPVKFKYLNSVLDIPGPALEVLISLFSWAVLLKSFLAAIPEFAAPLPPLPTRLGYLLLTSPIIWFWYTLIWLAFYWLLIVFDSTRSPTLLMLTYWLIFLFFLYPPTDLFPPLAILVLIWEGAIPITPSGPINNY
jgi:hypothetical protein